MAGDNRTQFNNLKAPALNHLNHTRSAARLLPRKKERRLFLEGRSPSRLVGSHTLMLRYVSGDAMKALSLPHNTSGRTYFPSDLTLIVTYYSPAKQIVVWT
jgi:hypothetical protein